MRTHFLHPQFRVLSMNIKARQYKARYDKKKKKKTPSGKNMFQFSVLSAVRGYMVATPLLALVKVTHHLLSQQ